MHCHDLQSLILTSCHSITGEGLVSVGDMCKQIRKLSISKCKNLKKFAITKLFVRYSDTYVHTCVHALIFIIVERNETHLFVSSLYFCSCSKLEELDVSYYLTITDDEVRLLAQSCPHMMIFNAKESYFLSDQSVLALSRHCPGIQIIASPLIN